MPGLLGFESAVQLHVALRGMNIGRAGYGKLPLIPCEKPASPFFLERFPYVCPEPVSLKK